MVMHDVVTMPVLGQVGDPKCYPLSIRALLPQAETPTQEETITAFAVVVVLLPDMPAKALEVTSEFGYNMSVEVVSAFHQTGGSLVELSPGAQQEWERLYRFCKSTNLAERDVGYRALHPLVSAKAVVLVCRHKFPEEARWAESVAQAALLTIFKRIGECDSAGDFSLWCSQVVREALCERLYKCCTSPHEWERRDGLAFLEFRIRMEVKDWIYNEYKLVNAARWVDWVTQDAWQTISQEMGDFAPPTKFLDWCTKTVYGALSARLYRLCRSPSDRESGEGYSVLLQILQHKAVSWARTRVEDPKDLAERAVSATMGNIARLIGGCRSAESFLGWCSRALYRKSRDLRERMAGEPTMISLDKPVLSPEGSEGATFGEMWPDESPSPEDQVLAREVYQALYSTNLTRLETSVVWLTVVCEAKHKEVKELLLISNPSRVLKRALAKLRARPDLRQKLGLP